MPFLSPHCRLLSWQCARPACYAFCKLSCCTKSMYLWGSAESGCQESLSWPQHDWGCPRDPHKAWAGWLEAQGQGTWSWKGPSKGADHANCDDHDSGGVYAGQHGHCTVNQCNGKSSNSQFCWRWSQYSDDSGEFFEGQEPGKEGSTACGIWVNWAFSVANAKPVQTVDVLLIVSTWCHWERTISAMSIGFFPASCLTCDSCVFGCQLHVEKY